MSVWLSASLLFVSVVFFTPSQTLSQVCQGADTVGSLTQIFVLCLPPDQLDEAVGIALGLAEEEAQEAAESALAGLSCSGNCSTGECGEIDSDTSFEVSLNCHETELSCEIPSTNPPELGVQYECPITVGWSAILECGCVCDTPPCDCTSNIKLRSGKVSVGDSLSYKVTINHNRDRTVQTPFFISLLGPEGEEINYTPTREYTLHPGDEVTFHRRVELPPDSPPGEYQLKLGIGEMEQGFISTATTFEVVE